jgi:hypothetical protein
MVLTSTFKYCDTREVDDVVIPEFDLENIPINLS